jgi:hypothetical protein
MPVLIEILYFFLLGVATISFVRGRIAYDQVCRIEYMIAAIYLLLFSTLTYLVGVIG